jgi:hypothetical protein
MKFCRGKYHAEPVELPEEEFPIDKSRPSGRHGMCKECHRKRKAEWTLRVKAGDPNVQSVVDRNTARRKERRKWIASVPVAKRIYIYAKSRATAKGVDFDIDVTDVVVPDVCPILGIPLDLEYTSEQKRHNCPSLDRIDSSKGYIRGNVHVVSWRANHIKNDSTLQELILLGEYAKKTLG